MRIQKAKRELRPCSYSCSGAVALLGAYLRAKHCVHLAPSWLSAVACVSLQGWLMSRVWAAPSCAAWSCVTPQQSSVRGSCKAELTPVLGSSWSTAVTAHWLHLGTCCSSCSAASFKLVQFKETILKIKKLWQISCPFPVWPPSHLWVQMILGVFWGWFFVCLIFSACKLRD